MQLVHLASRPLRDAAPHCASQTRRDPLRAGFRIGLPDLDMAMPPPMPRQNATSAQAGIAVIPVVGTLVRRSMGIEAASGLMSYGEIESTDAALADPVRWRASCSIWTRPAARPRVFELAERIRAASTIKPIWAHANDAAYSAAFAIAAACQRLIAVADRWRRVDWRDRAARRPVGEGRQRRPELHRCLAGSHKNDFSPHEPLRPQATPRCRPRWIACTTSS